MTLAELDQILRDRGADLSITRPPGVTSVVVRVTCPVIEPLMATASDLEMAIEAALNMLDARFARYAAGLRKERLA